jgi:hypothetical protein
MSQRLIALQLGIDVVTLLKHYRMELDTAIERINAKVTMNLVKHTEKFWGAALAWLQNKDPKNWRDMRFQKLNDDDKLSLAALVLGSMGKPLPGAEPADADAKPKAKNGQ